MDTWERIKFLMEYKNLNITSMSKLAGISNNVTINKIINLKRNPYQATLDKIAKAFPDINPEWINTGNGAMLRAKHDTPSNAEEIFNSDTYYDKITTKSGNAHDIISPGNYRLSVKLVEPKAFAGYLSGYQEDEFIEDLPEIEIFVKEILHGTYRAFRVKGESMEGRTKRAIYDGDVVVGRSLDRQMWRSRLHTQDRLEWVIVHSGGIVIKHISSHDVEAGLITCVSYNDDKIVYPDFVLNLNDVYELYGVVKSITDR